MDFVWENEPVSAKDIVAFATEGLGWKKNTTYTVITRLCERGLLQRTEDATIIVRALVSREELEL